MSTNHAQLAWNISCLDVCGKNMVWVKEGHVQHATCDVSPDATYLLIVWMMCLYLLSAEPCSEHASSFCQGASCKRKHNM